MATAKAGPRKTSRTVTLRITEGEGDFLIGTLAQVCGHPSRSPRKYANRITAALEGALGYGYEETDSYPLSIGYLIFRPYGHNPTSDTDRLGLFRELILNGWVSPS